MKYTTFKKEIVYKDVKGGGGGGWGWGWGGGGEGQTNLSAESTPLNAFDKPFMLQMFSQINHAMKSKQQKENKRENEILVVSVFATFMLSP